MSKIVDQECLSWTVSRFYLNFPALEAQQLTFLSACRRATARTASATMGARSRRRRAASLRTSPGSSACIMPCSARGGIAGAVAGAVAGAAPVARWWAARPLALGAPLRRYPTAGDCSNNKSAPIDPP